MKGWFAMNRAMFEHPLFVGRPERVAAWAWMIAMAAWKETKQDANGKTITVKRGQLLTSYRQMSKATGVPVQPLRTLIEKLQGEGAINTDTSTGRLLVTISNYEKYQNADEGKKRPATHEQHTSNTQKEQGNKETTSSSEEDAPSAPQSRLSEISVSTSALWNAGKPFLSSRGVRDPGAIIGRWLKDHEPTKILGAIDAAQRAGTHDPIPYITEALKGTHHGKRNSAVAERVKRVAARFEAGYAHMAGGED